MDPSSSVSVFSDQISIGLVVVYIMEKLKKASWLPWLTQHTDNWNRLLSVILGSIAAAGIVWTYDSTGGILTVKGLTLVNGITFLWIVFKQVVYQEAFYKGLVKPNEVSNKVINVAVSTKADILDAVRTQLQSSPKDQ